MQNIDFSAELRKRSAFGAVSQSMPGKAETKTSNKELSKRNRIVSFTLAALVLVFTVGLYSGIKIGEMRNLESSDCIVRYPDGHKQEKSTVIDNNKKVKPVNNSVALANTSDTVRKNYILKVGRFKSKAARKLTLQLNNLPEMRNLKAEKCKGVEENEPNRAPAFRMQTSQGSGTENVLIGCFSSASRANHMLSIVKKSGLPGSARSELYEY